MTDPGLYVETDFILAFITADDWLQDRAEALYEAHGDALWTARETLIELMMAADREG